MQLDNKPLFRCLFLVVYLKPSLLLPQASSHTSVWEQLSYLARWSQSEDRCGHAATAAALQPQTEPSRLPEQQRGEIPKHLDAEKTHRQR